MVRWLAASVVVLLGLVWWLYDGDGAAEGAPRAGAVARPVTVRRSAGGGPATRAEESRAVTLRRERSPTERAPRRPPKSRISNPPVAATPAQAAEGDASRRALERVAGLLSAGRTEEAESLLRNARANVTAPGAAGRLALVLARVTDSPAERRQLFSEALAARAVSGSEYEQLSDELRSLNAHPRASLHPVIATAEYVVRPNDSLWKLCTRTFPEEFGTSPEVGLVRLLNDLSGDNLHVGQRLVVPLDELRLVIDRRSRGLVAYLGDVALLAYRVGLGKEGRTPRGEFVVRVKQEKPTWYRDGRALPFGHPDNILGTRWLGFENHPGASGYGIHGTERPESIGKDESMGCVRMRNEEVEELFDFVPRGTTVTIP